MWLSLLQPLSVPWCYPHCWWWQWRDSGRSWELLLLVFGSGNLCNALSTCVGCALHCDYEYVYTCVLIQRPIIIDQSDIHIKILGQRLVYAIYPKADFSLTWDLIESTSIIFGQTTMKTVLFFGQAARKGHPESFGVKMHLCSSTACFLGDEERGAETVFNPNNQDLWSLNNVQDCFLNWAACGRGHGRSWVNIVLSREELGNAWATGVLPSCFVIHWGISLLLVFLALQPVKFVSSVL